MPYSELSMVLSAGVWLIFSAFLLIVIIVERLEEFGLPVPFRRFFRRFCEIGIGPKLSRRSDCGGGPRKTRAGK